MKQQFTKVRIDIEVELKEGRTTIEMEFKETHEIEDCDEGKVVILNLRNGEKYTGIFKGIDNDEDIMIGSLSGGNTLGLNLNWVNDYFEQVFNKEYMKS